MVAAAPGTQRSSTLRPRPRLPPPHRRPRSPLAARQRPWRCRRACDRVWPGAPAPSTRGTAPARCALLAPCETRKTDVFYANLYVSSSLSLHCDARLDPNHRRSPTRRAWLARKPCRRPCPLPRLLRCLLETRCCAHRCGPRGNGKNDRRSKSNPCRSLGKSPRMTKAEKAVVVVVAAAAAAAVRLLHCRRQQLRTRACRRGRRSRPGYHRARICRRSTRRSRRTRRRRPRLRTRLLPRRRLRPPPPRQLGRRRWRQDRQR